MIRWRDVQGFDVIATEDAETVGNVATIVVDVDEHAVSGFGLERDDRIVGWDDLAPLAGDVVTIADAGRLRSPSDDRHGVDPVGMPMLTDLGDSLGDVDDVELDERTGEIATIVAGGDRVDGARLVGIGRFAVVVRAESGSAGPSRSTRPADRALDARTKAELYELAKAEDVPGRSSMTKAELVDALRASR